MVRRITQFCFGVLECDSLKGDFISNYIAWEASLVLKLSLDGLRADGGGWR